ncbi:hypothetical protein CABS03_00739 [Colletotrichum abscissum]|uniref:Uncharacterized protein n=1 Tax=Colletotrichum abscissum TaxID=1671311 RepID=A0A9P9XLY2_9PEZI|nr:hypothetical protein CABS02_03537 [Colletotrichum abscissum]
MCLRIGQNRLPWRLARPCLPSTVGSAPRPNSPPYAVGIRHPGRSTPAFSRWIWTCWPLTSLGSGTGEGGTTEPSSVGPPTLRNSTETIPSLP